MNASRRATRAKRSPRTCPGGRGLLGLAALVVLLVAALGAAEETPGSDDLLLATTTSVRDSGLLDALLPEFTAASGTRVRVVAVGTGAALRMGRKGDADILLTHAPDAEQVLVDDGLVRRRTPFMQNHFVIAGPKTDPARVGDASSAEQALARIVESGATWVSRDDDSGTHKREKALFLAAGLDPESRREGLVRTGSGMGLSLQVAGERRAYILSDIGTFLAFRARVDLVALSKPSPSLRNVYSILQLEAKRFDHPIRAEAAEALERFLLAPGTQKRIASFGRARFGRTLFEPLPLESPVGG